MLNEEKLYEKINKYCTIFGEVIYLTCIFLAFITIIYLNLNLILLPLFTTAQLSLVQCGLLFFSYLTWKVYI